MSEYIDLRSDTVTQPTPEMRQAMFEAEVGDDGFGEDPTVNKLEARAAELMGKEAGLFVVSGTMADLVAILTHCGRGVEAVVGDQCHILHIQGGNAAALGGIPYRTMHTDWRGMPDLDELQYLIRPKGNPFPPTGLVCLENSHNRHGGTVLTPDEMRKVKELAHSRGVPVHLDGARIFNAAVALGIDARELADEADTVMFCLSKGLAAPMGSMLTGSKDFIARARHTRHLLGGNLRQAGIMAAAGLCALENPMEQLTEDHANARLLAEGLAQIPGLKLNLDSVQTNIVIIKLDVPGLNQIDVLSAFQRRGLKALNYKEVGIRMLTHYGITKQDVAKAISIVREVMEEAAKSPFTWQPSQTEIRH